MKNLKKLISFTVIFAGITTAGFAQIVTASSTAAALIVAPLTITNSAGLHFGTIMRGTTAGTVTVETGGTRTSTGGVTLSTITPLHTVATFTIEGEPARAYTIALPASITIAGPGAPMTVNTFLSNPVAGTYTPVGASTTLSVGATLGVAANQVSGTYTGSFNVSVNYN